MACDSASVQAWASGIGVPACIGTAFCAKYGRLPNSVDELDSWGDSAGYRQGGNWTCTPSGGTGSGSGSPPSGTTPPASFSPMDWITAHPIEAGLGALVVVMLVRR